MECAKVSYQNNEDILRYIKWVLKFMKGMLLSLFMIAAVFAGYKYEFEHALQTPSYPRPIAPHPTAPHLTAQNPITPHPIAPNPTAQNPITSHFIALNPTVGMSSATGAKPRLAVISDSESGNSVTPGDSIAGPNDTDKVYYRNKVVVVTYHDVSPDVYSRFVITPQAFSSQLDEFSEKHFHVITDKQFADFLHRRGQIPPNAVLLTFDDGYQTMYRYVLPILRAHHMQGTFFQIVASADKSDSSKLSWSEIKSMHEEGMAFGSHTYDSHYHVFIDHRPVAAFNTPILRNGHMETPAEYHERVYNDFVRARKRLSQAIGEPVTLFAWPYGYGTWAATAIAHEAGYDSLFTTEYGAVSRHSNPSFIKRVDVGKTEISPAEAVRRIIDAGSFMPWLHYDARLPDGGAT
jgi:peptidoglycan/xylan/chitin deacetylase (PgdA/CDA1 family)